MFCCSNCFRDNEIRAIINENKTIGNCDFCGSTNVNVFDLISNHVIAELFDGLLDTYTPAAELPNDFPKDQTDLLKNILCYRWNIFNLKPDCIYRLIVSICAERYIEQADLFDSPIGIRVTQDCDYLEENSILKNFCWDDFVEGIKRENRFHSNYINTEKLFVFLKCAKKLHRSGEIFYRSRVSPDKNGFSKKEMGSPPNDYSKGGRINPTGISVLYLSDSKDTTLYEVRAGMYDYITVGRFRLKKNIEIINFADIESISPFIGIGYGFDLTQYAINIEHLRLIGQEIAKPLRNGNNLDYLPTQYISDFIKSKGFDGVEYYSTMCDGGINLAVFDMNVFKCTSTAVYDIKSIHYSYNRLLKSV